MALGVMVPTTGSCDMAEPSLLLTSIRDMSRTLVHSIRSLICAVKPSLCSMVTRRISLMESPPSAKKLSVMLTGSLKESMSPISRASVASALV